MANPADTTFALIREVTEGTMPATSAFTYLDYMSGDDFTLNNKMLTSDVIKQNRSLSGVRKTSYSGSGSLKTQFRRDASYEKLLESAFSGIWTANILKASNIDSFHTIEKKMTEAGSPLYWRYSGMQVTKFGLSVDAEANALASYDLIGVGRTTGTAIITGATYAAPTQGFELDGTDVGTMTINGITGRYYSLDLSIDHNREAKFGLGSPNAFGVGTSGNRNAKLTVKLYRSDLSPETVFVGDTPVAVSFTLGTGTGNTYAFSMPAGVGSIPKDEVSGSKALVTVEITGTYDATSGTDIILTRS